jgi:hypothetical protein
MAKTISVIVLGDVVLSYTSRSSPSDAEWDEYVVAVKSVDGDRRRALVVTDGGGPSASQRKKLYEAVGPKQQPTAIVTGSVVARGISTAMSWFNPALRVFSPHQLKEALAHLGVPGEEFGRFQGALDALKQRVSPDSSTSHAEP